VDWIGNYFKPGNLSALTNNLVHNAFDKSTPNVPWPDPSLYMYDNIQTPGTKDWAIYTIHYTNLSIPAAWKRTTPLPQPSIPVQIQTSAQAYSSVLADVGANARVDCDGRLVRYLDAVDSRVISNTSQGIPLNSLVTDPAMVGGYPTMPSGLACSDLDSDGMPDQWEVAQGLNPQSNDSAGKALNASFTNVEVYLNGMKPR
jgi:hypothetical protein